jgi:hypothetical protein
MDSRRDDPSDEELILHCYGEHADPEALEARLAASPAAARRREHLQRVLALAGEEWTVPDPGPAFEDRVWARLRPRLARDRQGRVIGAASSRFGSRIPRWLPSAAAAVVLLGLGYLAGRLAPGVIPEAGASPEAPPELTAEARQRLLVGTLAEHLERSERLFTELDNPPAGEPGALGGERGAARELLADNRLYRVAAAAGGRDGIAALLAELEPVLLELAHLPPEPEAEEVELLRRRIESHGLLFKTRVASELLQRTLETPPRPSVNV